MRPCRIVFAHSSRPWRGRLRREWWFKVVSPNGRTLAHSEGYARRADCISAACSMRDLGLILDNPPPPGSQAVRRRGDIWYEDCDEDVWPPFEPISPTVQWCSEDPEPEVLLLGPDGEPLVVRTPPRRPIGYVWH